MKIGIKDGMVFVIENKKNEILMVYDYDSGLPNSKDDLGQEILYYIPENNNGIQKNS